MELKICKICGEEFVPLHFNQKICKRKHYHSCPVCGKLVETTNFTHLQCCSDECTRKKRNSTNAKLYGGAPAKHPAVQAKMKITCMKNNGVEWPSQNKRIHEIQLRNYLSHYGKAENLEGCKKLQLQREETCLKNNGVRSNFQMSTFKETAAKTLRKKYGIQNITNCMQVPKIKAKQRATNIERYGVPNPAMSEEIKNKLRAAILKKYGVSYSFQSAEVREKIQKTNLERYGVPWYCMTDECKAASGKINSKLNQKFVELLRKNRVECESEFKIGMYSFDIKTENNILVEIDPTFTHNSIVNMFDRSSPGLSPDYHQKKTSVAQANGYRCIHVFDWDNWDKVLNLLKPVAQTVYARKCQLKLIPGEDADEFLNKYHLQSSCKGITYSVGLYLQNNELASLMTFGRPRYNKSYEYELLRYCVKPDVNIVGGSNRLFSKAIQDLNATSIVSYCDVSKFTGNVYDGLGFTSDKKILPSKHWFKNGKHVTDNLLRKHGYDQLFKTNYGKGTSNEQLMIENGWLSIYDCGQATYIWRK